MTALARQAAARMVAPGTVVEAATARFGAPVIASEASYAIAGHAALDAFAHRQGAADAVVLACFGDPGLMALREVCPVPVVGMADASILKACAMAARFSIVTGGARWKPMLEAFVAARGFASRLASVRTIAATGELVLRDPDAALEPIAAACRDCAREDAADVVILGGIVLTGFAARLGGAVPVPLLDGLECAIRQAETLAGAMPVRDGETAPVETTGLSRALSTLLSSVAADRKH